MSTPQFSSDLSTPVVDFFNTHLTLNPEVIEAAKMKLAADIARHAPQFSGARVGLKITAHLDMLAYGVVDGDEVVLLATAIGEKLTIAEKALS